MKIGERGGVIQLFRPSAESAVFKTVSGDSERASGDGKYFHEPGSEYAGAGQCGHTARPESMEGLQRAETHEKDTASKPDDHVFSAETRRD